MPRGPAARSPVMVPQMLAATIAAQYPASMVGRFRVRIKFLRSELNCVDLRRVATPYRKVPKLAQIDVNHRRREQRQKLRQQQATDDRDAKRPAQLRSRPCSERQWQPAEQCCHG